MVEWGEGTRGQCPIEPGGEFTATVEPGDYTLQAELEGFAKSWIEIVVSDGERKDVMLPLTRIRGGSVAGQVVSKDTGEPVDGAPVYLVAVSGRRTPPNLYRAMTDREGKYEIKDVNGGRGDPRRGRAVVRPR